jgi:hypothetical protein
MAATINPDTYRVFLEVLTKAPCATIYQCEVTRMFRGGPRNGDFYETCEELPGNQFDELPWDGEDGDIISADWTVPVLYSVHTGVGVHEGRISISLTHDGGIYVANPYGERRTYAVGRTGIMPGNRPGLDLRNRDVLYRYTVESDEAMVTKVLELLTAGGWQDAQRIVDEYDEYV